LVHVLTKTELLASITAMIVLEVYHLKWIWLSEWGCRKCRRKNIDCACDGRWLKYF
jgi:hypothetical protein